MLTAKKDLFFFKTRKYLLEIFFYCLGQCCTYCCTVTYERMIGPSFCLLQIYIILSVVFIFKQMMVYQQVLSLLWNLAHSDDVPTDIMDQALSAHYKILDYSCSQVNYSVLILPHCGQF